MYFFKKLSLFVLMGFTLVSLAQYWNYTLNKDTGAESIERWEARILIAKSTLPIERGIVGYVGEWDVPGMDSGYWDQEGEYLLTQYTLAPLIVKKGAVAEWNVAVLSPEAMDIWQEHNPGGFEVIKIKSNLYLIHRLDNP